MSPADFSAALASHQLGPLVRDIPQILQVNVGKRCNQACHHCHVDAGPARTEVMDRATAERVIALLAASPHITAVDLTGGAPELNPHFTFLVERARSLERRVIVRCNLTVILLAGMAHVPQFYRDHAVELVCSLPCYTPDNVDEQRGKGVFDRSIDALRLLNALGFGRRESPLRLDLVYNPVGAFLPPPQADLEARYREELGRLFGIEFHRLYTITNMPIRRFAEQLHRWGKYDAYLGLLVNHFNPSTVPGLMCRTLVSVGWQGTLYDCDFNQMLELPLRPAVGMGSAGPLPGGSLRAANSDRLAVSGADTRRSLTVWDVAGLDELAGAPVTTGCHCFGCTAGAGSSCGGALE